MPHPSSPSPVSSSFSSLSSLAVAAALAALAAACAPAPSDDPAELVVRRSAIDVDPALVVSQVFGGGGNANAPFRNDFVEIFNRGTAPASLDGLSVQYASATGTGNFASNPVAALSGSLEPGRYYLVQLAGGATGAALPAPDLAPATAANMSATGGKVALVRGAGGLACNGGSVACSGAQLAAIVDLVGYDGANFFEGTAAAPALTNTTAAVRREHGCTDGNDNAADFQAAAPAPRSGATPAQPCGVVLDQPPAVVATAPEAGATRVADTAVVSVTFSEPVAVAGAWYAIACSVSGAVSATATGGPLTFTLAPAAAFVAGEACTVTVAAAGVTDLDGTEANHLAADFAFGFTVAAPAVLTPIHDIQGRAHLSPLRGALVDTTGIVTALRSNGFYLQEPLPDADDATSEAIFVFTRTAPAVAAGDGVRVTGTVAEFRPGCSPSCAPSNSAFANLTTTELDTPIITVASRGNPLPPPVVLGGATLGARVAPGEAIAGDAAGGDVEAAGSVFDPATDGLDFYESLEGMRVRVDDAMVVGPTVIFSSGSVELPVLPAGGAGAGLRSARGGIVVRAGDFNPERIILADDLHVLGAALPAASVGDSFPGAITGVLDYSFGNFKLLPVAPLPALLSGGLQPETLALPAPASNDLTIASLNVENLDPTDPPEKFQRLAQIITTNLGAPDLLTLAEVQDDDGAADTGTVTAAQTFARLTAAVSAAGGPAYAFRAIDPVNDQDGGEPGGNIRVGILFRADRGLAFVDRPGGTSTAANAVIPPPPGVFAGGPRLLYSPGRIDPANAAWSSSRKPLAAELTFAGARLFLIANHFNSKGGDQPLFGRFQPPQLSSEAQRLQQAALVAGFVRQILTYDPAARVVVAGDLNDFEFSPPLATLKAAGLDDLVETLPPARRYSFNFDGNGQVLDHILVSPALRAELGSYDIVHVNSDLITQASDHDPEAARFRVRVPPFFLPPITNTARPAFPVGFPIPVRFAAPTVGPGGPPLPSLVARLFVAPVLPNGTVGTYAPAAPFPPPPAGTDPAAANLFTFDAAAGAYTFFMGTAELDAGTWSLRADLGDGLEHVARVTLRR